MKFIILFLLILLNTACSTNQKVLDKSRTDLKKYLDTPRIHRSQHMPHNINKFGLEWNQSENISNNSKSSSVSPTFYIARDINENLQYFLPFGLSYRLKDNKKFKSSISGDFSFGYSTATKGYMLPTITSSSRFILSKNQAIYVALSVNSFHNRFYRHEEESTIEVVFSPHLSFGHYYQISNRTYLSISLALKDQYYSSDCDNCIHENNVGQITKIDKQYRSWVTPISLSLTSRILDETILSGRLTYSKFGYEGGIENLSYGLSASWYFPTDG